MCLSHIHSKMFPGRWTSDLQSHLGRQTFKFSVGIHINKEKVKEYKNSIWKYFHFCVCLFWAELVWVALHIFLLTLYLLEISHMATFN